MSDNIYKTQCRESNGKQGNITGNYWFTVGTRQFKDDKTISFLDLYGLVNARVVSKGRYGNTREIFGSLPEKVVSRIIEQ